ncbi:hypothetical protein D3C80_394690 [compost metagenome]
MTRIKRQFSSNFEVVRVDRIAVSQAWLTKCQRTGLVEHSSVDLSHPLHGGAVLDHDAIFKQAASCNHLNDWHGKCQRTGAGDDECADRNIDRAIPVAAGIDHPADKCRKGYRMHHRHIKLRGAISEATIIGATTFGHVHQTHHFGEERILCFSGRTNDERG